MPPIEQRFIIGTAIAVFAIVYLYVVGGGGLTQDWLRIYTIIAIVEFVFIIFAIGTERKIFDFNFASKGKNNLYDLRFIKLSDYDLDIISGFIAGGIFATIGLLGLSVGIAPTTLSTGGVSSQFVTQFFAPYFEEVLITVVTFWTLLVWFKKVRIGFIILAIGTIMTFITSPSLTQVNLIGIIVIIMGLIFSFIYPLSELAIKNPIIAILAGVIMSAFLFSGLHGYSLSSNPAFNQGNIIFGYMFIFLLDALFITFSVLRGRFIFAVIAHMVYDGIQYVLQNPPITSTTIAIFISIALLYIIFGKLFENPNFLSNLVSTTYHPAPY